MKTEHDNITEYGIRYENLQRAIDDVSLDMDDRVRLAFREILDFMLRYEEDELEIFRRLNHLEKRD